MQRAISIARRAGVLMARSVSSSRPLSTAVSEYTGARYAGLPIGLRPSLFERILAMGAARPLPIQQAAMRRVFLGESLAIHSQTGSGKSLAFMLPLLLRLRMHTPRQVVILVPSRELALQSFEVLNVLAPATAELLQGSDSDSVARSILRHRAPIAIASAGQLNVLNAAFEASDARGGELLAEVRRTLRTVVLDESDEILRPRGKGYMLNRSRRNRALRQMPVAQALAKLVERQGDATYRRVQLIVVSATLSKRTMRDLKFVVGHEPGKIGLATPGMGTDEVRLLDNNLGRGSSPDWESKLSMLEGLSITPQLAAHSPQQSDGVSHLVDHVNAAENANERYDSPGVDLVGKGGDYSASARSDIPRNGTRDTDPRDGFGVRGGILHRGVPYAISHEMFICREHRKTAIIASVLDKYPGPALLVVRDDLRIMDVMAELRAGGIDGAMELPALGTAAARYHAEKPGDFRGKDSVEQAGGSYMTKAVPESSPWSIPDEGARVQETPPSCVSENVATLSHSCADIDSVLPDVSEEETGHRTSETMEQEDCDIAHERAVQLAGLRPLSAGSERWNLIVAHESSIRGLDMPQLRLVCSPGLAHLSIGEAHALSSAASPQITDGPHAGIAINDARQSRVVHSHRREDRTCWQTWQGSFHLDAPRTARGRVDHEVIA